MKFVRLHITVLSEHDDYNSGCPPDPPYLAGNQSPIQVFGVMSAICVCVPVNRCGAQMTDNLSTQRFSTQLSGVILFPLFLETVLITSLTVSDRHIHNLLDV